MRCTKKVSNSDLIKIFSLLFCTSNRQYKEIEDTIIRFELIQVTYMSRCSHNNLHDQLKLIIIICSHVTVPTNKLYFCSVERQEIKTNYNHARMTQEHIQSNKINLSMPSCPQTLIDIIHSLCVL